MLGLAVVGASLAAAASFAAQPDQPRGELGEVVRLGREIVENTSTHPLSKAYVGNVLNCTSCHLDAGTDPRAASFLEVATAYPAWSPRERRVITLEDRVLNCFMRSMNGMRPPLGSKVSIAITTYITWLSQGEPLRSNPDAPRGPRQLKPLRIDTALADAARGEQLYLQKCADCHGEDGRGTDAGPPVWGPQSYNAGAGFARVDKLSRWLKVAMPLGDPHLSDQEALDVAAWVNSHDRPPFVLSDRLPPPERRGEYNAEGDF
jgi:thiosulfate dehydrogenase